MAPRKSTNAGRFSYLFCAWHLSADWRHNSHSSEDPDPTRLKSLLYDSYMHSRLVASQNTRAVLLGVVCELFIYTPSTAALMCHCSACICIVLYVLQLK